MQANRINAEIMNHKSKEVVVLEMSCPWIENREKKDEEKSVKYAWPIMMGVTRTIHLIYSPPVQHYHGRAWRLVKDYGRRIMEVAPGKKTKDVLRNMQKSVVSSTNKKGTYL